MKLFQGLLLASVVVTSACSIAGDGSQGSHQPVVRFLGLRAQDAQLGMFEVVNVRTAPIVLMGNRQGDDFIVRYPEAVLQFRASESGDWSDRLYPPGSFVNPPDKREVAPRSRATFLSSVSLGPQRAGLLRIRIKLADDTVLISEPFSLTGAPVSK